MQPPKKAGVLHPNLVNFSHVHNPLQGLKTKAFDATSLQLSINSLQFTSITKAKSSVCFETHLIWSATLPYCVCVQKVAVPGVELEFHHRLQEL